MTTGEGTRLPLFPPATGFTDGDYVYMSQSGATVKGTIAQLRTALAKNGARETFTPGSTFTASISGTLLTVSAFASGAPLAIGQTIYAAGVTGTPTISSLGTGTGGAGTYNLSVSQATITSEAMGAASATQFVPGISTGLTLAGTYGSINNIFVLFDATIQTDCTLISQALGFNPVVPTGIQQVVVIGGFATVIGTPSAGTVIDASVAPGSKLYDRINDIISVKDYGLTVTTATLASAVAAVQAKGGGLLKMGGNSAAALPSNYAGALLEYDGPNVPITLFGEALGSAAIAQKAYLGQDAGSHIGFSHSIVNINANPVGSGQTGPNSADFALSISHLRQNAATTAIAGEMDAMQIVVRNGGPSSDTTAILGNVANYGTGFNAFFEATTSAISGTTVTEQIDVQCALVDTRAGIQYGLVLGAFAGSLTAGLLIQSQNPGTSNWADFIQCIYGTYEVFRVDGFGQIWLTPDTGGNNVVLRNSGGSFTIASNNQASQILSLDQTGDLTLGGYVNASTVFKISGVQVVGAPKAGYGTPSGASQTTSFPGASATLAQTSAELAQVITDLKSHGLLAA